jgi:hypothetical protein
MLGTVDPDQVGLDLRRLARLDAHFAGYVETAGSPAASSS